MKPYVSYRLTKNKSKLDLIISAWLESKKIVVEFCCRETPGKVGRRSRFDLKGNYYAEE